MKSKIIFLSIFIVGLLASFTFVKAESNIVFFYSETCPHCIQENEFLNELEKQHPEISVQRLVVSKQENIDKLKQYYSDYNVESDLQGLVPITFIGDKYFTGFTEKTGEKIKDSLFLDDQGNQETILEKIKIPFIGEINIKGLSPLVLSVVLGGLDGFNACAMVALGFLLAVLITNKDRKKTILIGGVFILVSGLVYFLFISAWLNLFLVLERLAYITLIVGIVVIVLSIFLLREYFHGIVCKLCDVEMSRKNIFARIEKKMLEKMKILTSKDMPLIPMLFGVAIVAAGINLVELVCSFGFPLAFTKTLTQLNLSSASHYFYIFVYIFFYMLDDFLIFLVAVWTLRITQVSEKYLKIIKLVSGLALLGLGILMIFNPQALSF